MVRSSTNPQILICSAFAPELTLVLHALGAAPDASIAHGMVGAHAVVAAPLGIGVVSATAQLTELLLEHPTVRQVLFIGTAGSSDLEQFPIGTNVRVESCVLLDADMCSGAAHLPAPMAGRVACTSWMAPQQPLSNALLLTPIGMTHSIARAAALHTHFGPCIENLEGYAVAWTCQRRHIPCDIWCAISNQLGPDGHQQWQMHHQTVSAALQQHALTALMNMSAII